MEKSSNIKISDAGPLYEIHVYDSNSGKIYWKRNAFGSKSFHQKLLLEAEKFIKKKFKTI